MRDFTPAISEKICTSVSEFSINAKGHCVKPIKVHAGRFNSYYLLVDAADFSIMIRQVERSYHESGNYKDNSQGFMCLSPGGSILYNGNKYERGHKLATLGSEVNAVLSDNLRIISCFIDESLYNEYFIDEEKRLLQQAIMDINQDNHRIACDSKLSEYLYQLIYSLSNGSLDISSETAYNDLRESLYVRVFDNTAEIKEDSYIKINPKSRLKILNEALAFIHDNDDNTIRVSDISKHVNTTQRNLQKIFDENLGVSPKTYLISKKLTHIRDELLQADPDATNVQEIAEKYGVVHKGNFAKSYQEFFGEYPNETLVNKPSTVIFERKRH